MSKCIIQSIAIYFPILATWLETLESLFAPTRVAIRKVRASPYFDEHYYLSKYDDVAESKMDAVHHYVLFGASEGRSPSPNFTSDELIESLTSFFDENGRPRLKIYRMLVGKFLPSFRPFALKISTADEVAIIRHISHFKIQPKIAVVMPVYNPEPEYLRQAIQSVQNQLYDNWELCIANDASTDPEIREILDTFAAGDERIKIIHREFNGHISEASNSAIELVDSEFMALLDHDDLLNITALYEVALVLQSPQGVDVIYSDEDIIDTKGRRKNGYLKPDFNIELLLGQNFVSHLGVYRTSIVRQIGGFRRGYEGSQDYDLVLRVFAKSEASRFKHIQAILYHWRRGARQKSFSEAQMKKCVAAARRAIQDFLDNEGEGAKLVPNGASKLYSKVKRKIPGTAPLVSCIIPTKDGLHLLKICLRGILKHTKYQNLDVIVVDNDSVEPATIDFFTEIAKTDRRVRLIHYPGPFNYSAINNFAVKYARGDILALLNNDIEITNADWLEEMVTHVIRPGIGAVGAKLYYPNGRIQHAGVVLGTGGVAGHSYHGTAGKNPGYFANAVLTREVSAVTAACMVLKKEAFLKIGGFDEINLPVAYNDTDLCLRLRQAGYRNIFTPFAELIHYESVSRGKVDTISKQIRSRFEVGFFKKRWAKEIANDPFYNPGLELFHPDYRVAPNSRRPKPWAKHL